MLRQRGFTMIEMLTVLSVLVITLALAAPGLYSLVRGNRVRAAQGELVASLMLARSEAARRGVRVGVVAAATAAAGGFARGWTVWVDANADGNLDNGETTLRSVPDFGSAIALTEAASTVAVVYTPRGFLAGGTAFNATVCGTLPGGTGFRVRVEPVGLADVSEIRTCP